MPTTRVLCHRIPAVLVLAAMLALAIPAIAHAAPTVAYRSPGAGATVSGTIQVVGSWGSQTGALPSVRIGIVGGHSATATPVYGALQTSGSWSGYLDTRSVANGTHTLFASVTDSTGTTEVRWSVSVANLRITISAPSAGAKVSGVAKVTGLWSSTTQYVRVETGLNNAAWSPGSVAYGSGFFNGSYSGTVDTRALPDGYHTVTVRIFDASGRSTMTRQQILVDNTLPAVAVSRPAAGSWVRSVLSIAGSASDANGIRAVYVRAGTTTYRASGTTSWAYQFSTSALPEGPTTLAVTAEDLAGNRRTVSWPVVIDRVAPTITLGDPAAGTTFTGYGYISGCARDTASTPKVYVSIGSTSAWQPTSSACSFIYQYSTAGYARGLQTVYVRAVDAAGNASMTSRQFNFA